MASFSVARSDILRAVEGVMEAGARSAVAFVGSQKRMPVGRVKVTRRFKHKRNARHKDFVLTVGHLSYGERRWCATRLKAYGQVPKLHLKF